MANKLQSLQVQIISDVSSSNKAIDDLIGNLGKLQTALSKGLKATKVANGLSAIARAANSINANASDNLDKLADALGKLGGIASTAKISKSLTNNLTVLVRAANSIGANANTNLSDLGKGLSELSVATSGAKISKTLATNLQAIAVASNSMSASTSNNIRDMGEAIRSLSGVETVRVPAVLTNGISRMQISAASITPDAMNNLRELATAITPLASLGKMPSLSSLSTGITKLVTAVNALDSAALNQFKSNMQGLADGVQPLIERLRSASEEIRGLNTVITTLNRTANRSAGTSGSGGILGQVVGMFSLQRIIHGLAECTNLSMEYEEDLNLFTVALGKYAKQAQTYAETVSNIMGIDSAEWMRNQGVFMTLATGFGIVGDRAAVMSKQLTQLAYDVSSYYNITVSDAMTKLNSAFSGELEPVRRLGYDLSQTKLKAVAAAKGITKSFNAMNQAEKAELRYYTLMTQVTQVHGDMSRTLESPANQIRVLKAQFTMAARQIGNVFIPALNLILPAVISVIKIIRILASEIAGLFGYTLSEVDYSSLTDATSEAEDNMASASKSAKEMLADFDELNVIASKSNSGSGTATGTGSSFDWTLPTYDFIGERVDILTTKIQTWWDKWRPSVLSLLGTITASGLVATFSKALANAKEISTTLGALSSYIGLAIGLIVTAGGTVMQANAMDQMMQGDFSWDTLITEALAMSLKTIGATLMAKSAGSLLPGTAQMSNATALQIGIGLSLIITSINLSVETIKNASNLGFFQSTALSGGAGGIGGAAWAVLSRGLVKAFPNATIIKSLTNPKVAIGLGLIISSITLSAYSIEKAETEGLDVDTIGSAVVSGLEGALGVGLITSTLASQIAQFGATTLGSHTLMFSAGVGFLITGITVAIDNIKDAQFDGWDNKNWWTASLSSVATALGVGLTIASLGVSAAAAVPIGIVAGVVIMGVQVWLGQQQDGTVNITWGDQELAQDMIAAKASSLLDVTSVDSTVSGVEATINLAKITITNATEAKNKINTKVSELASKVQKIQLSIDAEPGSTLFTDIDEAINGKKDSEGNIIENGLIQDINSYLNEQKLTASAAFAISPYITSTGEDVGSSIVEQFGVNENLITSAFGELGTKLSNALATAAKQGLKESGLQQQILELYNTINSAQLALTTGSALSAYDRAQEILLSDLTQESYNSVMMQYMQNKSNYYDQLVALQQQAKDELAGQIAAMEVFAEYYKDKDPAKYDEYMSQIATSLAMYNNWDPVAIARQKLAQASQKGDNEIVEAFRTLYSTAIVDKYANGVGLNSESFNILQSMMDASTQQQAQAQFDQLIPSIMQQLLTQADYQSLLTTMQATGMSMWDIIGTDAQSAIIQNLANSTWQFWSNENNDTVSTPNAIAQAFANLGVDITGFFSGIDVGTLNVQNVIVRLNKVTQAANNAGRAMASVEGTTWTDIPTVSVLDIQREANGGFVDQGQLFVAREAGAEMVGSIGRRTAVANNDQIVAGISNGVSQANGEVVDVLVDILAAIRSNGGSSGGSVQPTAAFGRFVKRSLEMYSGVTG